jgi:pimeloyl-ACP methyl ester carboxylesterase
LSRLLFPKPFREEIGDAMLQKMLAADFEPPAPKHGRRAQLSAVLGHDTRQHLPALAGLPTLILKPERDLLIRPKCSDTLVRLIPGARLVCFPDAGHGLIRQNGDQVARLIAEHADNAERPGVGSV